MLTWPLSMDLLLLLALLLAAFLGGNTYRPDGFMWDYISLRYGVWYEPPYTDIQARHKGYTRKNDVCRAKHYHGFLFHRHGDSISMPIYDANGFLVGLQSAIPGSMQGFNSRNETISLPPAQVMPPILEGHKTAKGLQMYTITAYFKHPRLVCNPGAQNVPPYKGLYFQMGYDPEKHYMAVPLELKRLKPEWKVGNCVPKMGNHYFLNLTKSLPCENIYPVFLMYNTEGKLGAFGWMFQGKPPSNNAHGLSWFSLQPEYYPYTFDPKKLPACMFNKEFRVSGLHIWLQHPKTLLCSTTTGPAYMVSKPTTASILEMVIQPSENVHGGSNRCFVHIVAFVLILVVHVLIADH